MLWNNYFVSVRLNRLLGMLKIMTETELSVLDLRGQKGQVYPNVGRKTLSEFKALQVVVKAKIRQQEEMEEGVLL